MYYILKMKLRPISKNPPKICRRDNHQLFRYTLTIQIIKEYIQALFKVYKVLINIDVDLQLEEQIIITFLISSFFLYVYIFIHFYFHILQVILCVKKIVYSVNYRYIDYHNNNILALERIILNLVTPCMCSTFIYLCCQCNCGWYPQYWDNI